MMLTARRWTRRHYRARVEGFSAAKAAFSADSHEALAALEAARVHGVAGWQRGRRSAAVAMLAAAGRDFVRTASIDTAVQASLAASSGVVVLVVGGILVAHGSMSIGELLGFYAVVALLLRQIGPVVAGTATVMSGQGALERIEGFLGPDTDVDYSGVGECSAFDGAIEVQGASFWFGEERVLDGVDLVIGAGEHVAIMGPNGSGKSTLVAVMLGVRPPHSGRVLAGGVPLEELDLAALRRRIGVVLQEPVLIRGTIAENIAWGRADPASEEVRVAAGRATAAEFISRLPDGYETMLGEDGAGLSGGERQRIAIARALVGSPKLLLLDEPSNHLDQASIDVVLSGLAVLPGNPTVVMVTHDIQVAARADRMVTLRDGRLVEDVRVGPSAPL
jgi:ABC-type bacteriocin/lantibiotic exporter with double-glycine peptidase domain